MSEQNAFTRCDGSGVITTRHTREELRKAWDDVDGQGGRYARQGGACPENWVAHCPDEESALRLTALLCRLVFNMPSCAWYDNKGQKLYFYLGSGGDRHRAALVGLMLQGGLLDEYGPLFAGQSRPEDCEALSFEIDTPDAEAFRVGDEQHPAWFDRDERGRPLGRIPTEVESRLAKLEQDVKRLFVFPRKPFGTDEMVSDLLRMLAKLPDELLTDLSPRSYVTIRSALMFVGFSAAEPGMPVYEWLMDFAGKKTEPPVSRT